MLVNLFSEAGISSSQIVLIVLLAVMVIVLIVLPMFTNKKRAKAVNELHSSIAPGDVIKTVGGVIGKVIAVREISPVDKEMVIETGEEGKTTTLVFDIQAVYQVISKANAPVAEPFATSETPVAEQAPVSEEVKEETVAIVEEPKTDAVLTETETEKVDVEPKKVVKKTQAKK